MAIPKAREDSAVCFGAAKTRPHPSESGKNIFVCFLVIFVFLKIYFLVDASKIYFLVDASKIYFLVDAFFS